MSCLGLENGRPAPAVGTAVPVVPPVTVLVVGWDPPRMSCMKKDSVGDGGLEFEDGPILGSGVGPGVYEVRPINKGGCGASWMRSFDESAEDRAVRKKRRESGNLAIKIWLK